MQGKKEKGAIMEGKFFHVKAWYRWTDKSCLLRRTVTKEQECSSAVVEAETEEEAWEKYIAQQENMISWYLRWGLARTPSEGHFERAYNNDCDTYSVEKALEILTGEQFAKWAKRQGIIPTFQMITKELT